MTSSIKTRDLEATIARDISGYRASFERDGYVLVPGVLSADEVKMLRTFFGQKFAEPEKNFEGNDYFEAMMEIVERFEEISWLWFKQPTVSLLKSILGDDFVLMRGSTVHHKCYGWWWHKDTSNGERAGHKFHYAPSYRQVLCAYYLQDNTEQYGGGLDVEPGSHLTPDPGFQYPRWYEAKDPWWRRIFGAKTTTEKKMVPAYNDHLVKKRVTVPNKAGDLVIFDMKLNHRASQKKVDVVPPEHEKLAVFLNFSRNNETVELANRYYNGIYDNPFGREYPKSIVEQAAKVGMILS